MAVDNAQTRELAKTPKAKMFIMQQIIDITRLVMDYDNDLRTLCCVYCLGYYVALSVFVAHGAELREKPAQPPPHAAAPLLEPQPLPEGDEHDST